MRFKVVLRNCLLLCLFLVGLSAYLFLRIFVLPIPISNVEALQKIGNSWRYPIHGHYVLTRDIDASATAAWNDGAGFIPIGLPLNFLELSPPESYELTRDFSGTLDGRGYAIRHLHMNHTDLSAFALFERLSPSAEIKNLGIVDHDIRGDDAAAVLAVVNKGVITNTYATGIVHSRNNAAAGLVLGNYDDGVIDRCYAANQVLSDRKDHIDFGSAGGLVVNNGGLIKRSYTAGLVSGGNSVGFARRNFGEIHNCFTVATVVYHRAASGFVGDNDALISNCYAAGPVTGKHDVFGMYLSRSMGRGQVENAFWNADIFGADLDEAGVGLSTADMLRKAPFVEAGWDFGDGETSSGTWTQVEGQTYPLLATMTPPPTRDYSLSIGGNHGTVATSVEGNTVPAWGQVRVTASPDPGYVFLGWRMAASGYTEPVKINPLPIIMHNHVALEAVFAPIIGIESIEALQKIGRDPDFPRYAHYKLTQDIDASATLTWNEGAGFTPIGESDNRFIGALDGQGHVIHGLHINRPDESYMALVAWLGFEGQIKDLILKDGLVRGHRVVAALACWSEGLVAGCASNVTVRSNGGIAAGLVTQNYGKIHRSFTTGMVFDSMSTAGGLVAYNFGDIAASFSTAHVSGGNRVGGLVGYHFGNIKDSFAAGVVTGNTRVGGLIGQATVSQVENSFSMSMVEGVDRVGGFIGALPNRLVEQDDDDEEADERKPRVEDSFWCVQHSGQRESIGGTGIDMDAMLASSTFREAGWDFSATNGNAPLWKQVDGQTIPHFYYSTGQETELRLVVEAEHGNVQVEPAQATYPPWSPVTLHAEPAPGYAFAGWVFSGQSDYSPSSASPLALVLHEDTTLRAVFLPDAPIEIDSIASLQRIGESLAYPLHWEYVLTQDIDALATANWNDGAGFTPLAHHGIPFNGVLHGNGHVIQHIHINRPHSPIVGLFVNIGPKGRIEKLGLDGGHIEGGGLIGALASYNAGLIDQCFVDVSLARSSVPARGRSPRWMGGFIGINIGKLQHSYFRGDLELHNTTGRLVGENEGQIQFCYVSGDADIYGWGQSVLIGNTGIDAALHASFWLVEKRETQQGLGIGRPGLGMMLPNLEPLGLSNGEEDANAAEHSDTQAPPEAPVKANLEEHPMSRLMGRMGGDIPYPEPLPTDSRGLTDEEMKTRTIFDTAGWDFETIWAMEDGVTYPYLQWEQ